MSDKCSVCGDCESVDGSFTDYSTDWSGSDDDSWETNSDCSECAHEARNDDLKNYDDCDRYDDDDLSDGCDKNSDGGRSYRGKKYYSRRKRNIEDNVSDDENGFNDDKKGDSEKDSNEDGKSGEENYEGDELREKFKGFDGYPAEIQQFIKDNNKESNVNPALDGNTDKPADKKDLEALLESFGGMMKNYDGAGSEEEDSLEGDNGDDQSLEGHSRGKRSITNHGGIHKTHHRHHGHHHRHGGHRHHRRHGHHRRPGHHKTHRRPRRSILRMSKIICPTGKSFVFTTPATDRTGWKCGNNSKFITLYKHGRMGRREYNIVSKEFDESKTDHNIGKFSKYNIIKIQKVVNPCFWKRYCDHRRWIIMDRRARHEAGDANERLLWHGSTKVMDLLKTGFDERFANPGGMFGAGLYFATNSSKSNQYVYLGGCPAHKNANCHLCERNILLCRVALGKVMQYTTATKLPHAPKYHHSVEGVVGGSLKYSENIVYRGEQADLYWDTENRGIPVGRTIASHFEVASSNPAHA